MKRLLLINPVGRRSGYLLSQFSTFSPLSLAYVAALTPSHWEIKIIDENFDTFEFEEADLVGITAFSSNINRAYELAQTYRKKKIKVVMGGIHASMLPDEALNYCDAVVQGEVEGVWEKVISDFEKNNLVSLYNGPQVDLKRYAIRPRRDLLSPKYFWNSVQTSRGCPFNCHFCSVSKYLGNEYRQRDPDQVLDEIEQINGHYITFVDDNLVGHNEEHRNRAKKLFKGLIDRGINKHWWMQTSINAAEDLETIQLASKSGCMMVFIGFETISEDSLLGMKKRVNLKIGVENYKKVVDRFHRYGIGVLGAFIIGNDYESSNYYKALAEFIIQTNIDVVQITILTPLPGTAFMEELEKAGRLIYHNFPDDWEKYRFSYVVHNPKGITPETIYSGDNFIKERIYSFPRYQFRILRSLINLKNPTNFYTVYKLNEAYKRGWQNSHYYKNF
jgi:radical SAM superfamily enzyme YgiQ (UPF0313 family)